MLTKADKKYFQENFLTIADKKWMFETFTTKDELLSTKDELLSANAGISSLKNKVDSLEKRLDHFEWNVDERFDEMEERFDAKLLAFRNEIMNGIDVVIGELKSMREEFAILNGRTSVHTDQIADHESRLQIVERAL